MFLDCGWTELKQSTYAEGLIQTFPGPSGMLINETALARFFKILRTLRTGDMARMHGEVVFDRASNEKRILYSCFGNKLAKAPLSLRLSVFEKYLMLRTCEEVSRGVSNIKLMKNALDVQPNACVLMYGEKKDFEGLNLVNLENGAFGYVVKYPVHSHNFEMFKKTVEEYLLECVLAKKLIAEQERARRLVYAADDLFTWRDGKRVESVFSQELPTLKDYYFYIIVQKDKTGTSCLKISLPGGKRELGESSEECAMRETYEETGIRVNVNEKTTRTFVSFSKVSIYYVPMSGSVARIPFSSSVMAPSNFEGCRW